MYESEGNSELCLYDRQLGRNVSQITSLTDWRQTRSYPDLVSVRR